MTRKVKVKIHELVNQRGISLRELSRLTDIRHAALSELANQKIADTLELDDIRDIIDLIEDKDK